MMCEHVVTLQKTFYGMTSKDKRKVAFYFAGVNQLQHPFSDKNKMAGPDLLAYFMNSSDMLL
jgi:hypothetical protein